MSLQKTKGPSWNDVKAKLAAFDHAGLVGLLQALYAASKDNQALLQARLGLGEDTLKPYKAAIDRWLWPDRSLNQAPSAAKAKKVLADYRNAAGQPEELTELMVFYCERAAGFAEESGLDEESYYDALARTFEQAVRTAVALPPGRRADLLARLDLVRRRSHDFGYGVGADMDDCFIEHGFDIPAE
ncbi:MAG TPA: hypothetical protein VLF18_16450 [Tahibacter sp.]|uniref:hypothetical protein n=1 Tax=Tahibacter sp. TaxID=2056211 RepID=UPI002BF681ED|nr:hypothetical protein [Tahibacter sp.]HSX61784.1 hypothetical protein [Tahibacter sp.]